MNKIHGIFLRMPVWVEVTIVMCTCFGLSILGSVFSFASGDAFTRIEFNDEMAIGILLSEIVISLFCIAFLLLRGYKIWKEIKFEPSFKGLCIGLGLYVVTNVVYVALFLLASQLIGQENIPIAEYIITFHLLSTVAVALINPLFEEVFVVGYLFERLNRYGAVPLIALSTLIRVSYHLYQGWIGIISILPLGLLFALAYWRTRNLWPLYVAHVLMDFVGLMANE